MVINLTLTLSSAGVEWQLQEGAVWQVRYGGSSGGVRALVVSRELVSKVTFLFLPTPVMFSQASVCPRWGWFFSENGRPPSNPRQIANTRMHSCVLLGQWDVLATDPRSEGNVFTHVCSQGVGVCVSQHALGRGFLDGDWILTTCPQTYPLPPKRPWRGRYASYWNAFLSIFVK